MNSIKLRKDCPMRHENGNCLPGGGFCTAVNDPICEAMHNAYYMGKSDALCKKEDLLQLLAMERQQYYDELQKAKAIAGELRHLYEQAKAEAAEVKHGKWIERGIACECNLCGKSLVIEQGTADMNYCTHCGAKMDAKKEGAANV